MGPLVIVVIPQLRPNLLDTTLAKILGSNRPIARIQNM